MNIDDMKFGDLKAIAAMFSANTVKNSDGLCDMIGKKVIIRTYSAGCWFGTLSQKAGSEVILTNARRMWKWFAAESISLSAVSLFGIKESESRIVAPVESVWLNAIEIIPCSHEAIKSLEGARHVKAG